MMKRFLLGALFVVSIPTSALAQAFGVQMGAPVSRYNGRHPSGITNQYYYSIDVPQPNGEFESYNVFTTPETGICKITGLGRTHRNDDDGTEAAAAFAQMRDALKAKYGASKDFDFLKSGALWSARREWVWSVYKKERVMTSFWDRDEKSSVPEDVRGIMLDMKSVDPSSGAYVTVSYEFANFPRCQEIMKGQNSNGL